VIETDQKDDRQSNNPTWMEPADRHQHMPFFNPHANVNPFMQFYPQPAARAAPGAMSDLFGHLTDAPTSR
jgi:hypothetical protein